MGFKPNICLWPAYWCMGRVFKAHISLHSRSLTLLSPQVHKEVIIWEPWGQHDPNASPLIHCVKPTCRFLVFLLPGPQTRERKPGICWEAVSEDLRTFIPEFQVIGLISMIIWGNKHPKTVTRDADFLHSRGSTGSGLCSTELTLGEANP